MSPDAFGKSRQTQFLSSPLQSGLRFFRFPLPAALQARLAAYCPVKQIVARESDGFTTLHFNTKEQVRPHLSAGGFWSTMEEHRTAHTQPRAFWSKPVSVFGLSEFTTFISGSLSLVILLNLSSRPPNAGSHSLSSQSGCHLTMRHTLSQGLRTTELLPSHALVRSGGRTPGCLCLNNPSCYLLR